MCMASRTLSRLPSTVHLQESMPRNGGRDSSRKKTARQSADDSAIGGDIDRARATSLERGTKRAVPPARSSQIADSQVLSQQAAIAKVVTALETKISDAAPSDRKQKPPKRGGHRVAPGGLDALGGGGVAGLCKLDHVNCCGS